MYLDTGVEETVVVARGVQEALVSEGHGHLSGDLGSGTTVEAGQGYLGEERHDDRICACVRACVCACVCV